MTIFGVGASGHTDFVAVIEFRNSAQRQDQTKSKFELFERAVFGTGEAGNVMIRKKWGEEFGMGVERILAENGGDSTCGSAVKQNVAERKEERKVEDGSQASVYIVPTLFAANKKGCDRGIGMENFADCGELRIEAMKQGV